MWGSLAIAGLVMLAAVGVAAEDKPSIVKIAVPELDVFDKPNGKKIGTVSRTSVKLPLKVEDVSSSKQLKVTLPGYKGPVWIDASYVQLDRVQLQVACEPAPTSKQSAVATRGLGAGCPK